MPESFSSINLAKSKQVPAFDKFINWSLTVGRLIVIITEVVALSAFIYRFSLDEQIVEIHSKIKQKQTIISLLKQDENKYRNLQDRIALAADFSEKSVKTNKVIRYIIDSIPQEMKISNLTFNTNRINMEIDTSSISQLTNFVNPLRSYPEIRSISIDNIENKPSVGLLVKITAILIK